jgi:copper chaperone CopZ
MKTVQLFKVEGMTCKNCKAHVERDIAQIDGIEDVYADLATGEVEITGNNISFEKIKDTVEKAGYVFKGMV